MFCGSTGDEIGVQLIPRIEVKLLLECHSERHKR